MFMSVWIHYFIIRFLSASIFKVMVMIVWMEKRVRQVVDNTVFVLQHRCRQAMSN